MSDALFPEATREMSSRRAALAPDTTEAFRDFSSAVFEDRALPRKTKELIAVAVAHVTQCPYCIRGHTKRARSQGAKKEEVMEAIWVAGAMRADGAYAHAERAFVDQPETDRADLAPEVTEAFQDFSEEAFREGVLPVKAKQLLAVAVAHTTQCEYCIPVRAERARDDGASDAEIMEAIWVAAEMRTGGAYAHAALALDVMADGDE